MAPVLTSRAIRLTLAGLVAVILLLLIVVAAFPWGVLKGIVTREATERFGRPVTIGSVERIDSFGFHPRLAIRDVRIPQAGWAGTGDFARVGTASVQFSVWPLLMGKFKPQGLRVEGLRLALVRDADGRTNWSRPGKKSKGGGSNDLRDLTVSDGIVSYLDHKQNRQITADVVADPRNGMRVQGRGSVRDSPISLRFAGPAPDASRPWPFTASIEGPALAMTAKGTMDRPFDTNAMTIDVTAQANDLKMIDGIIEAGLFRTRPVRLVARVRRDAPKWTVESLKGTIGRSRIAGSLIVDKVDGRSKLSGKIDAAQLDFDDLSSPEGRAEAAALEQRIGARLVPNTRIDIDKIDTTDGTIAVRVGRILSATGTSSIRSLSGTVKMDHRVLTIDPLRIELPQGPVIGRVTIDQSRGQPAPTLRVDLALNGRQKTTIDTGGGSLTGRISARARLTGVGETIRDAIGRSNGSIGMVALDGDLPQRYAAAIGFDIGRAVIAGSGQRAGLRCLIVRLAMKQGTGQASPVIVDTTLSQMRGQGTVRFPDEAISLQLTGAPKTGVVLRIPGSAALGGTISAPALSLPQEVRSAGNIFKAIGRRFRGDDGPRASDASCPSLAAQALR